MKQIPRWITSWPDWFGIHGNVEVVPASDYDALASRLKLLEKAYWIVTGLNPAQDLGEDSMSHPLTDEEIIDQAKLTASVIQERALQSPARVAEVVPGRDPIWSAAVAESPAKEQPGEVHCINDPRCAEWCGGDECFVPKERMAAPDVAAMVKRLRSLGEQITNPEFTGWHVSPDGDGLLLLEAAALIEKLGQGWIPPKGK